MEEVVSFSGGKDSLVVMDMFKDLKAVYVYHDLEFDQTLEYVESLQDNYDIDIIRSKVNFFDIIRNKKLCIPSRRMKWCCTVLKFVPLAAYARKNKIGKYYTGVRGDESLKRSTYSGYETEKFPWIEEMPILKWTEKDVWRYIKQNNLPINPLYQLVNRVGCFICPNNGKRDWGAARDMMPKKYAEFKEILKDVAETEILPESRRYYLKGGWTGWTYKTEIEITDRRLKEGEDHIEVEKKLNCVGCAACTILKNIKMECIARNYNPHRKVAV